MNRESRTATPIIVVGINRSGTKWLSNEIGAHPDVASIQDARHGGIIESNLLTEYGRGFDLTSDHGYAAFLAFWEQTHFFSLAGGDVGWFEHLERRPANSVQALRLLLDRYAIESGKSCWVQKIAPIDAKRVLEELPDARVVAIRRRAIDTVRSKVVLDARRGIKTGLLRAGMSQGIQSRQLQAITRRDGVLTVDYETLKADRIATMERVFGFLRLSRAEAASEYRPNTSFPEPGDRASVMGWFGEAAVGFSVGVSRILPLGILQALQRVLSRGRPEIIPGTFIHHDTTAAHQEP